MTDRYHQVIGIDLGISNSVVSVFDRFEEEAKIVPNPFLSGSTGNTPSVVSFDRVSGKFRVGWQAKLVGDAINAVHGIKYEMGGPTAIGDGRSPGEPNRIAFADEWFLPQEICAVLLLHLKEMAQDHIGQHIRDAVIGVPATFTSIQRKAIEEAALLAGLYPRQIIPEPVASAICYDSDHIEDGRKTYLVYDFGGDHLDLSIVSIDEGRIEIIAVGGNSRLGGTNFDEAIVKWIHNEVINQRSLRFPFEDRELAQLRFLAERAKVELSSHSSTELLFHEVWPDRPPTMELTREKFEELAEPTIAETVQCVDAVIQDAQNRQGMNREAIDGVMLVGGSTKIPKVKEKLLEYFCQDEHFVLSGVNPEEVVSRGAGIAALKFRPSGAPFDVTKQPDNSNNVGFEEDSQISVCLIAEHSLGFAAGNVVRRVIERGTQLPVSVRADIFENSGPTEFMDLDIYEGEDESIEHTTHIGTLRIGPMEPKPAGEHQFEVTFSLDQNGLLSMMVVHINDARNYQALFDRKTGVGTAEALTAGQQKIMKLYGANSSAAPPPNPNKDTNTSGDVRRELPGAIGDNLSFTITSPRSLRPGEYHEVDLWVHLAKQRSQVIELAKEKSVAPDIRVITKGPTTVKVARGSSLTVRLRIKDLKVSPREETILWEGEVGNASFAVHVPSDIAGKSRPGRATVYLDGLQIVVVSFVVNFEDTNAEAAELPLTLRRHKRAFASYASEDIDAVAARIQMARKVAPELNVFLDKANLRSGERWKQRLKDEILSSDVMYLFWSRAASKSSWVDWEWRCGFEHHGIDFIDPVPLISPRDVPPPNELGDELHFDDWILAFARANL